MSLQSSTETRFQNAFSLLSDLIREESLSGKEDKTALMLEKYLAKNGVESQRLGNNIWAKNKHFDPNKKSILFNSHHDTVKPNAGYTKNPFEPVVENGKLFGLGSNDAGGCLVSLIEAFLHFYEQEIPYNIILAATAEEENSGKGGVESILGQLKPIDFAIVGEPTEMKMAVAEKGLMVLDCQANGKSGHAARDQGINAIYEALADIDWFRSYRFEKESTFLGPIKMSVTMIKSGYQHNVVPDVCEFVVDVRSTDAYSNEEILEIIREHVSCEVSARSTRLRPSSLPAKMPVFKTAKELGISQFGSPTTSDQAVMDFPSLKMGPGRSERSHTPDEFIYVKEIKEGIEGYITLLEALFEKHTIKE